MIRDERGIAYVETLIVAPVLFMVFASMFTFVHLAAAHLIVQRAASAGARAAVVFMPDDPVYYAACSAGGDVCKHDYVSGGLAAKESCVKLAVLRVLTAGRHFKLASADGAIDPSWVKVDWNAAKEWEQVTVKVTAQYDCSKFLGAFLCGPNRVASISSASTLNYQQGPVRTQEGL